MTRPPKGTAIQRLRKALDSIADLKQRSRNSPEFIKWRRNTKIAIAHTFGKDSSHMEDFEGISYSLSWVSPSITESDRQQAYIEGLERATAIFQSMIEEVEEFWDDDSLTEVSISDQKTNPEHMRDVFIIHGREEGTKEAVGRFISQLGLNPIILHEQPNQGTNDY